MMKDDVISAGTSIGAVTLKVADLDAMTAFYRDGIGLSVLAQAGERTILGSGEPLVVLEHSPLRKHAPEGAAGLFHTALLFQTQADLARALYSVATNYPGSFTGSSDHLVSEALYFDDPEGNGVELYWDRPRSSWQWNGGRVVMDTRYLDPNTFLHSHLTDTAPGPSLASTTTVGHVHLKVGDIHTARAFYADTLGFEVTNEFGSQALFVSAGGYHHHLGMNTWQSRGALDRAPALGLGEVAIQLPTPDDVGALRERLAARHISTRDDGRTLTFDDPWKNEIAVAVADSGD
jgi:catechol 2,3-dioxygenase